MKVLFAIAEAYPFAKVGGLGDVGASLPRALARRGHEVRVVLPRYPSMVRGEPLLRLEVPMNGSLERPEVVGYGVHDGAEYLGLDADGVFARAYGYQDDAVRPFVLFSKAVVAFAAQSGWRPDVIHGHDWHCGLSPEYARLGRHRHALGRTASVLTIHNLAYQGRFGPDVETTIETRGGGGRNLLARGIASADAVSTVSHHYLREIMTPGKGFGLESILRSRNGSMTAILNGVDYDEYDPSVDPFIPARYDATSVGRRWLNKAALQRKSGLAVDPEPPLFGMVARLVPEKGVALVAGAADHLADLGAQLVVVGVGDEQQRRALEAAVDRRAGSVAYHATGREGMARLVYAGSDAFLAPSLHEPCGLAALVALRYGAVPVVRRTGGLAETIVDEGLHPGSGLGFSFEGGGPGDLLEAVKAARRAYGQEARWRSLQRRAMSADFSWDRPGRQYEDLYRATVERRRRPESGR